MLFTAVIELPHFEGFHDNKTENKAKLIQELDNENKKDNYQHVQILIY